MTCGKRVGNFVRRQTAVYGALDRDAEPVLVPSEERERKDQDPIRALEIAAGGWPRDCRREFGYHLDDDRVRRAQL
jgi:hypothetical protein